MKKAFLVALLFILVMTAGCSMSLNGAVSSAPPSSSSSAGSVEVASAASETDAPIVAGGPTVSSTVTASSTVTSTAVADSSSLPAISTPVILTSTATRVVPPATATPRPPASPTVVAETSATPPAIVADPTVDAKSSDGATDSAATATSPQANATKVATTTPVFAFFFADWCNVCKTMRPSIDQLKVQYGDRIHFAYINVDDPQGKQAAATYRVWAIPFFVLLKPSGEIVGQWVGQQADTVFPTAFDDLLKSVKS
jgi:thioredoxin 1